MGLLAVFFVFDFAINFLSALLRAAKEQAYLLKATVAVACVFGGLLLVLPTRADGICQMGSFIAVQAIWAVLLLLRVVGRWPGHSESRNGIEVATPARRAGVAACRRFASAMPWEAMNSGQQETLS
jgi:hypothetical protein